MTIQHTIGGTLVAVVTSAALALAALSGSAPAVANPNHVDPATLSRGPDPKAVYLVNDTIIDGSRRIPATVRGDHWDLWATARGYVLHDIVQDGNTSLDRLVYVDRLGDKRLIARMQADLFGTAVSPSRQRIAWRRIAWREPGNPAVVTVANPDTGRVLAHRRFAIAEVVAVSDRRVLLNLKERDTPWTAWWWDYRRDTLSQVSRSRAVRADIRHDRIVLATGPEDSFCNRIAPLSHPERTLWESCRIGPRSWSPDGRRALATWTYFDETGTDRWLTVRDRTGARLGQVNGRLDWDAVWEDDRHFLTMAQSRDTAAVIRCTVAGRCERAGELWRVPWDGHYPPYYAPPPVLLPEN
jgi:hypothetical protein